MSPKKKGQVVSPEADIRILILDQSPVCFEGLRAIIARQERLKICDYTWMGENAADLVQRQNPDLLVIDPFIERADGLWLIKDVSTRFPCLRILVITHKPEEIYAERILRAGASGYWMKSGSAGELIKAIETVLSGQVYVSPRIALFAVHKLMARSYCDRTLVGNLTDRELHIFGLIGAGAGPGCIAGDLKLSRKTIETYQDRIKAKLGYTDASELRTGARHWVDSLRV